jgi:pimeloyl-ACP methyl ester carboxylesterase
MQSISMRSTLTDAGIGGVSQQYLWTWEAQELPVIYETLGQGPSVLLLPAFSTVSTRAEMCGLAEHLAPKFQVTALDWPGFGQSPRLPLDYRPKLYHQFFQDFVKAVFDEPVAVVAAGHAAGYAMRLAQ